MAATNSFIEPPPQTHPGDYSFSSLVQYGSPQNFSWTDNYSFPLNLVLWQETYFLDDNTISPQTQTLASDLSNTSYAWDGKPAQNISLSNIFWLGMYNASNESLGPLFKSQYFNVTSSDSVSSSSTTTTSSSSTTTTSSSSSSSSSSSLSSSTPTAQPITTPTHTTPPSTANHVALGAGLGAGLGGAALLLAVGLFCFLSRKRHNRSGKSRTPEVYQLASNDRLTG